MTIKCSKCGFTKGAPDSIRGKIVECPKCHNRFEAKSFVPDDPVARAREEGSRMRSYDDRVAEEKKASSGSNVVGKIGNIIFPVILCVVAMYSNPSEKDHRDYLKRIFSQRAAGVAQKEGAGVFSALAGLFAGSDMCIDNALNMKYHDLLLGSFTEISPNGGTETFHTFGVFGMVFKDFEWKDEN